MTEVVRNHKDTVFRMLYKNPKNALELYNGLCGKNYTDETQLRYNTLENAVYMNVKNDVSFLIHDHTIMYEQQATWNPNMPLRNLYYIADIFHNYERNEQELSIYGTRTIELPNPEFVVFYNGGGRYPEYSELRLSDSFKCGGEEPSLELKVKVYNISKGRNEALKNRCPVLAQYVTYTELIKTYRESMPLEEAVEKAVDECIKNGILKEFLMHQKAEVVKMSIYEYDEKEERRRLLKEAYREGEEAGESRGAAIGAARGEARGRAGNIVESIESIRNKGYSLEEACELLSISEEKYENAKKLMGEITLV